MVHVVRKVSGMAVWDLPIELDPASPRSFFPRLS